MTEKTNTTDQSGVTAERAVQRSALLIATLALGLLAAATRAETDPRAPLLLLILTTPILMSGLRRPAWMRTRRGAYLTVLFSVPAAFAGLGLILSALDAVPAPNAIFHELAEAGRALTTMTILALPTFLVVGGPLGWPAARRDAPVKEFVGRGLAANLLAVPLNTLLAALAIGGSSFAALIALAIAALGALLGPLIGGLCGLAYRRLRRGETRLA